MRIRKDGSLPGVWTCAFGQGKCGLVHLDKASVGIWTRQVLGKRIQMVSGKNGACNMRCIWQDQSWGSGGHGGGTVGHFHLSTNSV